MLKGKLLAFLKLTQPKIILTKKIKIRKQLDDKKIKAIEDRIIRYIKIKYLFEQEKRKIITNQLIFGVAIILNIK